jgi:glycosyltransferase involved in cell wall biosynthesis
MKILIPVDPEIPVPPKEYGGVERLVDGLVTAYTRAGHTVVLLAHPDSTARDAAAIHGWPARFSRGWRNVVRNALKLYRVYHLERPDVIHSFARLMYLYPTMFTSRVPFLMTYGRFISTRSTALASILGGKRVRFTSAAGHMLNHLGRFRERFTPVYNFTPVDYFIPDDGAPREHLMYLGRIEEIKGTAEAIQAAMAAGKRLLIAGNIQPGHDDYFNTRVKPFLDYPSIRYAGPVNDEQKRRYLQRAEALLFPIRWEEPFGIVLAEAMACGTPVIGFRRGSVPEVVRDGRTGFVVDTVEEMTAAIGKLPSIDRTAVRRDCEERFSREVVAGQYLELLRGLVDRNKNADIA